MASKRIWRRLKSGVTDNETTRPAVDSGQRQAGDGGRSGMLSKAGPAARLGAPVQAKLEVGAADDPLEREADATADRVMRMPVDDPSPAPALAEEDEEGALQREPVGGSAVGARAGGPAPAAVHGVLRSPGTPLEPATRAVVEPRFGRDFGDVRVHTDSGAAQSAETIRARAYTSGQHIAFAAGQYAPQTPAGLRLLSHELSHVVQQVGASEPSVARWPWEEPVTLNKVLSPLAMARDAQRQSFRLLNGFPMRDILAGIAVMQAAGTLDSMYANFDLTEGLDRPRLKVAMDAAKIKGRGTPATQAEIDDLKSRMAARELPADQQTEVLSFIGAAPKPAAAAAKQTTTTAGGGAGAAIPAERLSAFGSDEETQFKRKVYNAQMRNSKRVKTFFPGLAKDQMEVVEGGQRMRSDAAKACRDLLAKAREDLKAKQDAGDELALKVTAIKAGSGYRNPEEDFKIWDGLFSKYYGETQKKRDELEDGPLSDKAVQLLASYISQYKALPGFSNHTSGIAIDFITTEGKVTLGADKSQNKRWKESWFHKWLVEHAAEYGFKPLATEAWHWDYRGVEDSEGRPDSK